MAKKNETAMQDEAMQDEAMQDKIMQEEEEREAPVRDPIAEANELVNIRLPKGSPKEDQNFYVAINGKSYLIPKGQTVQVPRFVKDEIERSQRAQEAFYAAVDERSVKEPLT